MTLVNSGLRFGSPEKLRFADRYGNWAPGKSLRAVCRMIAANGLVPASNSWLPIADASIPMMLSIEMSAVPKPGVMFSVPGREIVVGLERGLVHLLQRRIAAGAEERARQIVVAGRQRDRVGVGLLEVVDDRGEVAGPVNRIEPGLEVRGMQDLQAVGRDDHLFEQEARHQRIMIAGLVGEFRVDAHDVELRMFGEAAGDQDVVERLDVAFEEVVVLLVGGQGLEQVVQDRQAARGVGRGRDERIRSPERRSWRCSPRRAAPPSAPRSGTR